MRLSVMARMCFVALVELGWLAIGSLPAAAQDVTITLSDVHQTISGFGGADVFIATALTDTQLDLFFTRTGGIGLTFLRQGIAEDGTETNFSTYANATKAAARGAKVWAAPWTAAAAQKDNSSVTNGGHLLAAQYSAWATTLANFASVLQTNAGVTLYAISPQNEPDFTATYESMIYSTAQMTAFLDVLGPKIAALSPTPLLVATELANWNTTGSYQSAIDADSGSAPYVSVLASHQYSGVAAPSSTSRPIWQSEMSGVGDTFDPTITHAMIVAQWINDAIATGNVVQWDWWWLIGQGTDNEGLIGTNGDSTMTKRYYTLGNYSKYVLPGYTRVGVTGTPTGMSITAFVSPRRDAIAIVAINSSGSTVSLGLILNGLALTTLTPIVTSATENLVAHAPLSLSSGKFSMSVPTATVTTFVGALPAARMRRFHFR